MKTCSEETQYSVKIIMYRAICWCYEFVFEKSTTILDITPCSPFKVNRRFGGTYCFHLEVLSCWHLVRIIRQLRWRRHIPPKRLLIFNGLHGVISHKHRCDNLKSYELAFVCYRVTEPFLLVRVVLRVPMWTQILETISGSESIGGLGQYCGNDEFST
jgi:hypothetical protein